MGFEQLSPEQQEKIRQCQTPEEVLALAKAEGYELTTDELDQLSGGINWSGGGGTNGHCPQCNSTSHRTIHSGTVDQQYVCNNCGCVYG